MSFDTLLLASKVASMLMFFPLFVGVAVWTLRRSNRERLEALALLPFQED